MYARAGFLVDSEPAASPASPLRNSCGAVFRRIFAHAATTSRQGCRAFPARAPGSPPGVFGVKQESPMTELYVFRGTTGHAEMVTDDKSGKGLPPHAFGRWVFSRAINVQEKRTLRVASTAQVLANVARDGFHHWPELKSDFAPATRPVRPPTLPPDFPDIAQNPSSELQPAPTLPRPRQGCGCLLRPSLRCKSPAARGTDAGAAAR